MDNPVRVTAPVAVAPQAPIDQLTAKQEEKSPAIIRAHHESEDRARRVYVNEPRATLSRSNENMVTC